MMLRTLSNGLRCSTGCWISMCGSGKRFKRLAGLALLPEADRSRLPSRGTHLRQGQLFTTSARRGQPTGSTFGESPASGQAPSGAWPARSANDPTNTSSGCGPCSSLIPPISLSCKDSIEHKTLPLSGIKTAGLAEGEFEGWASTFGNTRNPRERRHHFCVSFPSQVMVVENLSGIGFIDISESHSQLDDLRLV